MSAPATPPRVTVVLPNRNHARFLPQSLGSIAAQTRRPDEVIMIDDASQDDSLTLMVSIMGGQKDWRLIRHASRGGVVARLNEGLTTGTGEWIAFLGADDRLRPAFLARVLEMARRHPAAGLVCGCALAIGNGYGYGCPVRPAIFPRGDPGYVAPDRFRALLGRADNFFLGTVTLYRREAVLALGGFDPDLGALSDSFLARRLAARHGFCFLPEILGEWRLHDDNYSVASSTRADTLAHSMRRMHAVLATEPAGMFPPHYGARLDCRLRFGGARLLALDVRLSADQRARRIAALLGSSRTEQGALRRLLSLGRHGAIAALVWMSLKLRPFSLLRLLGGQVVRRRILADERPNAA